MIETNPNIFSSSCDLRYSSVNESQLRFVGLIKISMSSELSAFLKEIPTHNFGSAQVNQLRSPCYLCYKNVSARKIIWDDGKLSNVSWGFCGQSTHNCQVPVRNGIRVHELIFQQKLCSMVCVLKNSSQDLSVYLQS